MDADATLNSSCACGTVTGRSATQRRSKAIAAPALAAIAKAFADPFDAVRRLR